MGLAEFVGNPTLAATSHAIVFGIGVYCTLQWDYYRRLRKEMEESRKDSTDENNMDK